MDDSLRIEEIRDNIRGKGIANQRTYTICANDVDWMIDFIEKSLEEKQ